jgi:hypothetical protein
MPRIRTVKPDYPKHRKVRAVSRDARLLNIHLWNLADDEGRLQELPQWIIGEVFPTDEDVTPVVLREWLGSLHDAGLITRYEARGERYIECHDFIDHQVINKPRPSEIPAPDAALSDSRTSPVVLPDDSLPEREGKGNGSGKGMESDVGTPDAPLSNLLADLVAANDPNGKRPSVGEAWTTAEDRMLRIDERDPVEAERLIRWTQANEFWRGNVRSMTTFREKYGQLYLAAVEDKKKRQGGGMAAAERLAEKARQARAAEGVQG